jgi:SAM-dependent methyltransferase
MALDPKEQVARGYDVVADAYLGRFSSSAVRDVWLARFVALLPKKANILDLGCGAGVPVAKRLVEMGHDVTGVDGSTRQIWLARARVRAATFLHADMTSIGFPSASFDGVVAFYSITHVPAAEQGLLLARIGCWLRPAGVFVGSFGAGAAHDWVGEWLGAEMFFGHNDEATNVALVRQAELDPRRVEVMKQDNEDASFLWILARKLNRPAR